MLVEPTCLIKSGKCLAQYSATSDPEIKKIEFIVLLRPCIKFQHRCPLQQKEGQDILCTIDHMTSR